MVGVHGRVGRGLICRVNNQALLLLRGVGGLRSSRRHAWIQIHTMRSYVCLCSEHLSLHMGT